MKTNTIDHLLEKFWTGETNLEEEVLLKEYFNGSSVASEHEPYRGYFQMLKIEHQHSYSFNIEDLSSIESENNFSIRTILKKISVAASILSAIIITSVLYQQRTMSIFTANTKTEVEIAYQQTTEVLALLSNKLNKANASIYELGILDESKSKIEKND